ncbi:immunoglobulin-binding protein 1b [Halyomorpha halys]|uniref:immunoglobulin-binding protein 1b n=1 Tax=Halyomorpha halys TaxID=286706 RepID=UPI0006D501D2|nr:immunoglobulin-binding protein 1b [Halyomorpha halys]
MATSDNEEKKLLELFDEGYDLFNCVSHCDEPTNSIVIQNKIKQAMRMLEEATRLTSMGGIFSSNESVDEVATENLRLFLLPALLGTLALKLTVRSRIEVVETSDIYFRDFLQRCNDYGISNVDIPPPVSFECEEENKAVNKRPMFDIVGAARTRATKIQRFKEEKALEEELSTLSKLLKSDTVDEEVKRDYYLKLIKSFVSKAEEELDCLQTEKKILAHMKSVAKEDSLSNSEEGKKRRAPAPKPLMPVIITRDEVQKAVFGAGYPSLPTMTVQEFYDKRVQEGIFPAHRDLQQEMRVLKETDTSTKEEKEQEQMEKLVEQDDPDEIARQRAMDDFKDENKRGWGNRYNRS